ncbi:MAG: penicillin acylase family protein [Saprospiraceae bacterium]
MRYLKFSIVFLFTLGLILFLDKSKPLGTPLPPVGKLFSPFTGFWQNAEAVGYYPDEPLNLPGLSAPVKVVYDTRLVPHIFAENLPDALRAQGYLTARHRLWQMDLAARNGAGRLSEVIGERTLETDRFQRRRGIPSGARRSLGSWEQSPDSMALLLAYTEGVNAYISSLKTSDLPVEYKILDYKPELWEPYKTALVFKLNAALLCFKEEDVESSNTLAWLGAGAFEALFPERPAIEAPIVPDSYISGPQPKPAALPKAVGYRDIPLFPKTPSGIGSNNWAVSGKKTTSGNPILCNDPHLPLSLPSLWMEIQLHTPEMNVYGVSLPGIPGVILGFNNQVAWGWTNAGHDVLDWYEVKWADREKTTYYFDGETRAAEKKVEEIKVRGGKTVYDTITYTHWGPVVYEDGAHPKRNLAMRWAANEAPGSFEMGFLLGINSAKNFESFQQASRLFRFPGQNIAFASRNGDIGITVTGRFPVRQPGQGRFVQQGDASANFWKDYIPFEALPRLKNPSRGYVQSANQFSAGPSYPYYYLGEFNNYRSRYLDRSLAERGDFTVFDMMELQTSNYSVLAEEALPRMLALLDSTGLSPVELGMAQLLREWDYEFDADQVAPILFEEWWRQLDSTLWDEFHAVADTLSVLRPERWRTAQFLSEDPISVFWDIAATAERETPAITTTLAYQRAIAALRPKLDEAKYNWSKYLNVSIPHLAKIPAFSAESVRTGGHPEALNAMRSQNGPSWRMIVEMGPEIRAFGVYPGGQSGNPGSPHYDDFVDTWARGKYYRLFFMQSPEDRKQDILFEQQIEP